MREQPYGMDVRWEAHEVEAFTIYNRMCGEHARAAFADRMTGRTPSIRPAAELAAQARATVAQ